MILGWHRSALRFLRKNKAALSKKPLAVFVTCMSLTATGETTIQGVPVVVDEALPKPPKNAGQMDFKERYSRVSNYLRPILATCQVRPVSVGVFAGRLNFSNLQWWAMIFVVLILPRRKAETSVTGMRSAAGQAACRPYSAQTQWEGSRIKNHLNCNPELSTLDSPLA